MELRTEGGGERRRGEAGRGRWGEEESGEHRQGGGDGDRERRREGESGSRFSEQRHGQVAAGSQMFPGEVLYNNNG